MSHAYKLLLLMTFAAPTFAQLPGNEMRAHFIDVGQGDATLLEFSCGAILIDAGGELTQSYEFDGTAQLTQYLDAFFKRRKDLKSRLDLLVLSHPHKDHTLGAPAVIKKYRPKNIVTNAQTTGSGRVGQNRAHAYAAEGEATTTTTDDVGYYAARFATLPAKEGHTNNVVDPLACTGTDPQLKVLWGQVKKNPGWSATAYKNANNHSVVLRVEFGSASMLFTGDLETDGIKALVKRYEGTQMLNVDVYKVGHHGAANATTAPLLAATTPKIAVMMNGSSDREAQWTAWDYGHPRKLIVEALANSVTEARDAVFVDVAIGQEVFESFEMKKGVYSTGWDGTVQFQILADGSIKQIASDDDVVPLINVNVASAAELASLPTLGAARAAAIVKYRKSKGPFATVDALDDVPGIGPATIASIADLVTVGQ